MRYPSERADRLPEDRCDVCHENALMSDSDLVLCQCDAELWVHDRCIEAGGPCPRCGVRWTEQDAERGSGMETA
jgi:hypothetical protein